MVEGTVPLISGRWTRYSVRALEGLGVDVESLCGRIGLSHSTLTDRSATIDHGSFANLWALAVQETNDPSLGLHAVEHYEPIANDLFLHLVVSSETLGQGLERAIRFFRLAGHTGHLDVIPGSGTYVLRSMVWERDHSAWVEFRFGLYRRWAEFATQREVHPIEVRFQHPDRGAPRDLYTRIYGCPVTFSATETALIVHDDVMALRLPTACDETARALEKAAESGVVGPASTDIERQIRHSMASEIADGNLSEPKVAHALHMSERTLQRRLADAGCTFSGLLDDVRRRHALDLVVSTSLTFEAIAHAVGYGSVRSLSRSVKRWTGSTPSELRETNASERAG